MTLKPVLMPLPHRDFDPTEAAVAWQILHQAGIAVVFATADAQPAAADPMMLSGEGLDPWGWLPGLKKLTLIGRSLRADARGRAAYQAMVQHPAFRQPVSWQGLNPADFSGLYLPGGHAKGMVPYLEDASLQALVARFFDETDASGQHRPVAAVCHGVVLASRATSARTGRSVLHGRKTTALTWKLENTAWMLTRFLARFWDGDYYRTYREAAGEPRGYRGVEAEVKRALAHADDFIDVPPSDPHHWQKTSGLLRDGPGNSRPAWVVQDGRYLSARWPGDVHTLATRFVATLQASC